jgi:ABC-type nickel/cobalt efflux system permease component RcnA
LEVGNEVLPLRVVDRSAKFVAGQEGLPTLRIEAGLLAELPNDWEEYATSFYTDRNYEDRLGWREIVVKGGPGVVIENSTVPSVDASNELRSYPQDSLSSPLDAREARFTLARGNGTTVSDTAGRVTQRVGTGNNGGVPERVASLISDDQLSVSVIALSMLATLLWGAAHALTPGHGKTIVAAYLIGARGTVRHAGLLGLTVTLTHTAGVFALGTVTLYLSRYILPEVLYPCLSVLSGLLVIAIGFSLLYRRLRGILSPGTVGEKHTHVGQSYVDDGHAHSHGGRKHTHAHIYFAHAHSHSDHQHSHASGHTRQAHPHDGHAHSLLPPGTDSSKVSLRSLLALGVSGGLVPCPAALILLLSAISLGRLGFGMLLVVAFSAGLALVLTGIGILMIYARQMFERFSFEARIPRVLPVASALAVSLVGLVIVLEALGQAGVV